MKLNKKAFTLVEMLFVVMIAAMVLSFSAYKLKNLKNKGVEQGAMGFLIDLANAKEAMTRDLAMQGVNLDTRLKAKIAANIEVSTNEPTATFLPTNKSLLEYLQTADDSTAAALKSAFIYALSAYNYINFGIASPGEYSYYVNIGYGVPASCGTLGDVGSSVKVIAYMCKTGEKGWVYLNDGSIRQLN